jgi:TonB family protein
MKLTILFIILVAMGFVAYIVGAQKLGLEGPPVVSAVIPLYPPIARSANAGGDVSVDVQIDREGKVSSADAKGHALLRKVSEEAARRWTFAPAPNGEKERKARLIFLFRIMPEKTPYYDGTPVYYAPYKVEVRTIAPTLSGP